MTPAGVLDRVLPRWRATLASRYSPGDLDSFIERNRAVLESLVSQAMMRRRPSAKTPNWFELYNPRGGVPRETLPGYRRAREQAAAIFDRALSLLDEPAGEIDLASALAVLGSIDDVTVPEGLSEADGRVQLTREDGTVDTVPIADATALTPAQLAHENRHHLRDRSNLAVHSRIGLVLRSADVLRTIARAR